VLENRRGDQLRVQRLVHLAEQVFVSKMHCRNNFEL
jgi:ribosome-associated protein YbcJ (S4-like RNA binding protein)